MSPGVSDEAPHAAPGSAPSLRPLTAPEFELFRKRIRQWAGIHMADSKMALLEGRLSRRIRELGLRRFLDYYRLVEASASERQEMLDRITTHETRFFRDPWPVRFLDASIFPSWQSEAGRGARLLRAWSVACSTGEEPYSLAMDLLDRFPASSGWKVEVKATDLSVDALEKAQRGIYPMSRAERIPDAQLRKYMLRGTGGQQGKFMVGGELRRTVHLDRFNIHDTTWPSDLGTFDLIFCRNVLIYFDVQSRGEAISRLLGCLNPHGLLVVGHAESLAGSDPRARYVAPTIYALASSVPRSAPTPRERSRA